MSYLADDAAMRTHFDGQGGLVTRDEVPVQEREVDDSYDRLVHAIRVRSFDALLGLACEGLTALDVQNAKHDARTGGGQKPSSAAEVLRRQGRSDYYFNSPLVGYVLQRAGSRAPETSTDAGSGNIGPRFWNDADSIEFDPGDTGLCRAEGSAI